MKARRQASMGYAWKGTLDLLNQDTTINALSAPTKSLGFGALGGSVYMTLSMGVMGPPQAHPNDGKWCGWYFPVLVTANGPGMGPGNSVLYHVYAFDQHVGLLPFPPLTNQQNTGDLSIDFTYTISGLYPKGERPAVSLPTRNALDSTDFDGDETWYADSGSQVTISFTGPGGTGASDSGNLGATGEIDVSGNPWVGTYGFNIHRYDVDDTIYARCSGLEFNGKVVDLSNLALSNPGTGSAPDSGQPNWKRSEDNNCARIGNSGGMATWWTGTGNTGKTWSGKIWGPHFGTLRPREGAFDDSTNYPDEDIEYVGPIIRWEWDGIEWVSIPVTWTGTYAYYQQKKSWEWTHEWQTLSATDISIYTTEGWRVRNEEVVGGSFAATNDRQCVIIVHPISKDYIGDPWAGTFLTVHHDAAMDVKDPLGVPRPSLWVGSNGATPQGGNNDAWDVADGSTVPKVVRTLASRHFLRLNRLAGTYNPTPPHNEYHADWPIMLKSNLSILTTLDDPDWWDSTKGGVDQEDLWHWAEFAYTRLRIVAPRAETVAVVVDYRTVLIYDPCYTCANYRWNEFWFATMSHTATYTVALAAGVNDILVDLCRPDEKFVPEGAKRMHHVDTLTMNLPANSTGAQETWTLTGLGLTKDRGEGARVEPDRHYVVRYKRPWGWWDTNWFGFGAVVDGKDTLQLDYGYDTPFGKTRQETKLLHAQRIEHCPTYTGPPTRLDALKTIGRLVNELNYLDGWSAIDGSWEESSHNKDANLVKYAGSVYWFDLRHCHDYGWKTGGQAVSGALCVGQYQLIAGIHQDINYYKYPRGRIHGLAMEAGWSSRRRDDAIVQLHGRRVGEPEYEYLGERETDEHGRFRLPPAREPGWEYKVPGSGRSGIPVVNRSYTTVHVEIPSLWDPWVDVDNHGQLWRVACQTDGTVYCHTAPSACETTAWDPVTKPFGSEDEHYRPTIACMSNGWLIVCATYNGDQVLVKSEDQGRTWVVIDLPHIGGDLEYGGIAFHDGELLCVGWDNDDVLFLASSRENDFAAESLTTAGDLELVVCDAVVGVGGEIPRSSVIFAGPGVVVCVGDNGNLKTYRAARYEDEVSAPPAFTLIG